MLKPVSRTMLRELRWIAKYGQPGDLADYGANALAFYARERVLSALKKRGLIEDAETVTDTGRELVNEERFGA